MSVLARRGNIATIRHFGAVRCLLKGRAPARIEGDGQGRGNCAVLEVEKTDVAKVEPGFGIVKEATGFRKLLRRGLEKVEVEWGLVARTYNCKR